MKQKQKLVDSQSDIFILVILAKLLASFGAFGGTGEGNIQRVDLERYLTEIHYDNLQCDRYLIGWLTMFRKMPSSSR
ncbi:MAG: hypothetical protein LBE56_04220 [Tannerella sp.]|jgi:hypothetical protein|nr:hypothetical protein [Tannerella sp.]